MKSSKISALIFCAAMALSAVSCEKKDSKSSDSGSKSSGSGDYVNPGFDDTTKEKPQDNTLNPNNGENKISAGLKEEAGANDTLFKLNSVVETDVIDNGNKYVYLNVDISNNTDDDYNLSCLNNFYLLHDENVIETSDLITMFYAKNNLQNITINQDPFIVPANGTFSGFLCGFEVPESLNEFTVGFYPTQNDALNKSSVIEVKITKDDIQNISNGMIS